MIILHNQFCATSRDFVAKYGKDNVIIDWYNGGREAFESCALHRSISAFPSVVIHVPPHKSHLSEELPILDYPGRHLITPKVSSMADIQVSIDAVNIILAESENLGLTVDPLTILDLDRSDDYYRNLEVQPPSTVIVHNT